MNVMKAYNPTLKLFTFNCTPPLLVYINTSSTEAYGGKQPGWGKFVYFLLLISVSPVHRGIHLGHAAKGHEISSQISPQISCF
jgi:hypothetical protein